jgi:hypothetical protein
MENVRATINSGLHMAKAAFNKKKDSFYRQIGLELEEENSKMLLLERGFVWC